MNATLWYIVALVINLAGEYSGKFSCTINDGNKEIHYHISHFKNDFWTIDNVPQKGNVEEDIPLLYFKLTKRTILSFRVFAQAFNLNDVFELDKIDWKKVNEIRLKDVIIKQGETPIQIKRENNKIIINQNKGFLKDQKITVEW